MNAPKNLIPYDHRANVAPTDAPSSEPVGDFPSAYRVLESCRAALAHHLAACGDATPIPALAGAGNRGDAAATLTADGSMLASALTHHCQCHAKGHGPIHLRAHPEPDGESGRWLSLDWTNRGRFDAVTKVRHAIAHHLDGIGS